MTKIVVLMSGGLDSSTLASCLKSHGREALLESDDNDVYGLFIDYGQNTRESEYKASRMTAFRLNIPWVHVQINHFNSIAGSLLLKGTRVVDNETPTVVAGRNAILLSLGAAYAQTLKAQYVAYGAHYVDSPYPDCRPEFIGPMSEALRYAYSVSIIAPFVEQRMTKINIVRLAKKLKLDVTLTHSCYFNNDIPCGECPSCKLRAGALKEAGL